ncbi:MAG: hemerythrin domain-containing protein [Chloroflexi bacterium]|nr:hemerythrin domain-containing protein [Chloroflexota bacterium]
MALEALKEGHRKALGVVGEMERAAALVKQRGDTGTAAAILRGLLDFLENDQRVHFLQEEEGLFLYLGVIIGEGPLQAMIGEHESYWKAIANLKGMLRAPGDGAALAQLVTHITAMLRGHIEKEESAYFPMAESRLSPQRLKEVDEEMATIAGRR